MLDDQKDKEKGEERLAESTASIQSEDVAPADIESALHSNTAPSITPSHLSTSHIPTVTEAADDIQTPLIE